ncbi:MAG: hypothetical protein FJZ47_10260 [Candidatus Tectomicrobia bacterium]|uniref:Caa(3)-type oxidase subunit IV n=1 Tax=Tectimicrobiota bacterium TaxID=2528274 RepID=A0A938B3W0_UNCTE|nr:hypothetical protein [Candidatus Tectomicrobia bacterium]
MDRALAHSTNYRLVLYWLLGLAIGSVLLSQLPLPHTFTVVLIFVAATVKAWLVVWYFMHLRFEHMLIPALILTPMLAFAILLLVLYPDIAWR